MTNKKNTFAEIVRKYADNTKINEEETTMSKKKSIYDAIKEIKSDSFKDEMKEELWANPDAMFTWHKLWWDDDTTLVMKFFHQKNISEREFRKEAIKFCNMGDSKDRCRRLEYAFRHGDYIVKKGHIDGRMVIIVQILIDD